MYDFFLNSFFYLETIAFNIFSALFGQRQVRMTFNISKIERNNNKKMSWINVYLLKFSAWLWPDSFHPSFQLKSFLKTCSTSLKSLRDWRCDPSSTSYTLLFYLARFPFLVNLKQRINELQNTFEFFQNVFSVCGSLSSISDSHSIS